MCSASSWAAARRGGSAGAAARRGPALRPRDHPRAGLPRPQSRSRCRPLVTCEACTARAPSRAPAPTACRTCGGAGRVRAAQGFFTIERTCPRCRGAAWCSRPLPAAAARAGHARDARCRSHPRRRRRRHAHPARRRGRGGPARRPARRSLHLPLGQAARALRARRRGPLCRVPVPMTTAALGGEIEVPTIDGGNAKVKIPEGTAGGQAVPPQGQGHAGAALQAAGRPLHPGRG